MSYTFTNAAEDENLVAFRSQFDERMAETVAEVLDDAKQELAQNWLGMPDTDE